MEIKTTTVKMTTDIEVIPITAPFVANVTRVSEDMHSLLGDARRSIINALRADKDEDIPEDVLTEFLYSNRHCCCIDLDARQFKALVKTVALLDALEEAFGVAE